MANHKGAEWEWKDEKYIVQPGQFITSINKIVEKSGKGVTIQKVRTALKRFENYGFLTINPSNKNSLITIVNWQLYQSQGNQTNQQPNTQLTCNQQEDNKQLTPNNNVKNQKNVINEDDSRLPIVNLLIKNNLIESKDIPFTIMQDLNNVIDQFGFDDPYSIIEEAVKDSVRSKGKSWKYVYNKLNSWRTQGIKSLADLDTQFKAPKIQKSDKPNAVPDQPKLARNKKDAEALLESYWKKTKEEHHE